MEGIGGVAVEGVGGEERVPGYGVPVGRLIEQAAGAGERATFGVHSYKVVDEEAVRGCAGGDDGCMNAPNETDVGGGGAEGGQQGDGGGSSCKTRVRHEIKESFIGFDIRKQSYPRNLI